MPKMNKNISYYKCGWVMLWQFGPPMSAIWLQDVIKTVSIIICIRPTGLRLRHIGKTDPQCGTVQFCFRSGRLTCSARTGLRAVTTPLGHPPSTWLLKLTQVHTPNGISIGLVAFAKLTVMINRQTDRPRDSACGNRPHQSSYWCDVV